MINQIYAIDRDGLVGKDNSMPWHYKDDFLFFKKTTMGKKVIMGEMTFKSILESNGKPLPGRINVIATLTDFTYPGIEVTNDIFKYIEEHKEEDLFIIGGKSIFKLTEKVTDVIYMTYIDKSHEGNVFMKPDLSNFRLDSEKVNGVLRFRKYVRKD